MAERPKSALGVSSQVTLGITDQLGFRRGVAIGGGVGECS